MEEEKPRIPDLGIDAKNRIIEQTKKIPLLVNGKEILITIKKLSTGVRNRIRSECSKTTILGGQPQVRIEELEIQEKILAKAIVEAPFEVSVEGNYLDYPEVSEEFTYWFFANRFGYTPEQVDNLPYDRMVYFVELEREIKKQEKLNMNK